MLRKAGIQVISITEPFEDNPTCRLLEAMIESLDEFYSANLGEELTRGMRESASRGFYLSANPTYGYRKVKLRDGKKRTNQVRIKTGCGECVKICPVDALFVQSECAVVDKDWCIGCGLCVRGCPSGAAKLRLRTDRVNRSITTP